MDSLEGMPEFDKPENIPLVVPDLSTPVVRSERPKCTATKKDGSACLVPPLRGEKFCLGHAKSIAPELRQKWVALSKGVPRRPAASRRKVGHYTKDELLAYLSERLDLVKERFGEICNPEVDEMICNIVRTMGVIYRIEDASEKEKAKGWRIPEVG